MKRRGHDRRPLSRDALRSARLRRACAAVRRTTYMRCERGVEMIPWGGLLGGSDGGRADCDHGNCLRLAPAAAQWASAVHRPGPGQGALWASAVSARQCLARPAPLAFPKLHRAIPLGPHGAVQRCLASCRRDLARSIRCERTAGHCLSAPRRRAIAHGRLRRWFYFGFAAAQVAGLWIFCIP
jgi:hypothetical protein